MRKQLRVELQEENLVLENGFFEVGEYQVSCFIEDPHLSKMQFFGS